MDKTIAVFMKYRFLLMNLVSRDIKVKYRRSVLGMLWSVLNPLLMMLVMTAVFSQFFRFAIPNFPVYYLSASLLWNFFSESTSVSMSAITGNAALIKKVYIPKYIFPLQKVLSSCVNMGFSCIALIFIVLVTQTPVTITATLFPLCFTYVIMFSLGISLMLSAAVVYFSDIEHLYSVILTAWMYFTPIFYPENILGDFRWILNINPMYHFVTYFRNILMYNTLPSLMDNLVCLAMGVVSLLLGCLVFKKLQRNFILHI